MWTMFDRVSAYLAKRKANPDLDEQERLIVTVGRTNRRSVARIARAVLQYRSMIHA